jgi:hypothetical protein
VDISFSTEPFELHHATTNHVSLVEIPARDAVVLDGFGAPSLAEFRLAHETLLTIWQAFRPLLPNTSTRDGLRDLEVYLRPVHGDTKLVDDFGARKQWLWQQLIPLHRQVGINDATRTISEIVRRAGGSAPLVRIESRPAWRAVQLLHIGRWIGQSATLQKLLEAAEILGYDSPREVAVVRVADEDILPANRAASIVRLPIVGD